MKTKIESEIVELGSSHVHINLVFIHFIRFARLMEEESKNGKNNKMKLSVSFFLHFSLLFLPFSTF